MRDAGHRTPDAGHRTSDGEKSKNNISTPQGGGHNTIVMFLDLGVMCQRLNLGQQILISKLQLWKSLHKWRHHLTMER